jgi:hypothetical protein
MTAHDPTDVRLADAVSEYYDDPLGFVLFAFPWGEPGALENETGPDDNQRVFLEALGEEVSLRKFNGTDPVMPIMMNESSGHGTGKSVLGAWIAAWILSTRPHSTGTVTANSFTQLEGRTWAAIKHWMKLCITSHWFDIQAHGIYHKEFKDDWKVLAQTCRPENAQAFAGQHAKTSTSWYMFDEASEIPDQIWVPAYGGLTDGEPMFFAWGQPTRNSGEFHKVCFGSGAHRWRHFSVDSRTSRFTNKELIAQWEADYGEDSDYFRVRVRGLPPSQGDLQYIDRERVYAAQRRVAACLKDDPIIAGLDVARGGGDWNVVRFRKGLDGRSIPPIRIPGEQTRDSTILVSKVAELLADHRPERRISMMFVDSALGGPVVNRLHQLGFRNVSEINFGSASTDPHQANMRAYMWAKMKDWLLSGAIPMDNNLEGDLTGPGFHHNAKDQLVIESKESMEKRGLHSTDDGDALGLTFARPVMPPRPKIESAHVEVGRWS